MKLTKRWLFSQGYRFRLGQSMLTFVNFGLLVVAASAKIQWLTGISRTRYLLLLLLPAVFVLVWAIGYVLDTVVHSPGESERQTMARSPAWNKLFQELKYIRTEIKRVKSQRVSATGVCYVSGPTKEQGGKGVGGSGVCQRDAGGCGLGCGNCDEKPVPPKGETPLGVSGEAEG